MANLRIAKPGDCDQVYSVHSRSIRELCSRAYSSEQIDCWLGGKTPEDYLDGIVGGEMVIVEYGRQLAGFGHAIPGEVLACFVDPSFIKRGLGRAMMDFLIPLAQAEHKAPVKVLATLNAVGFYDKLGFVEVGRSTMRCGGANLEVVNMVGPHKSKS